jgi:hypothetical protein
VISSKHVLGAAACVLSAFPLGCASRQPDMVCRNELDMPGGCTKPPSPPSAPLEVVVNRHIAPGEVVGGVVETSAGLPIPNGQVYVAEIPGARTTTDSNGRFGLSLPPGSQQVLHTEMIGYYRRLDTLEIPKRHGLTVRAALEVMPLDGPCSGFEMVCVPRSQISK